MWRWGRIGSRYGRHRAIKTASPDLCRWRMPRQRSWHGTILPLTHRVHSHFSILRLPSKSSSIPGMANTPFSPIHHPISFPSLCSRSRSQTLERAFTDYPAPVLTVRDLDSVESVLTRPVSSGMSLFPLYDYIADVFRKWYVALLHLSLF